MEIFGFKSFGFRNTTVQFEPGLVSISGPNGSGKSNILDAIIFAMGENKPRMMRVDKLRSLIHDIEGARRGPKMARSSVHFDNSDRKIPVDSDAVEIAREMDANGDNTYYLNKKKTSRSHVLDLLDMANAGLGQLNAVQQGTVTRISEFTSEEKRKTIEDLIGLSYFDEKKTEAVKQLDEADRRLEIALAKMGEIKKRIDELEEERNQKMRHDLLGRELGRYKAISAANRMKAVAEQKGAKGAAMRAAAAETAALDGERGALRAETAGLEAEKSKMMADADAYGREKASLDLEISSAMEQYEIDNSAVSASRKRMGQIDGRIPEIRSELEGIAGRMGAIDSDILKIKGSIAETDAKKRKINDDQRAADSQRSRILTEQSEAAARKSEIDGKIRGLVSQMNGAELTLSKARHEKDTSRIAIRNISARSSRLGQSMGDLSGHISKLESMMGNSAASIAEIKSRIGKLQKRRLKIAADTEELGLILEKSSTAANQYESRIRTVRGLMHEDYTVARLKEDADRLGIVGLVYEMISWDKKYERPVLAASSDWIKAVVVRDFATMLGIAEAARGKKLPKLKIIPLDAIPDFKPKMPRKPGVLGVLADHVSCDPAHAALKTFLFGNILLADSRKSAHEMSRSGYKAVTLGGEYFEARGGTVVIDINSKISKLTKLISMSGDIDGLFQSIGTIRGYMLKKKRSMKKIDDSIRSYSDRLSVSESALAKAGENHANLKSRAESAACTRERLAGTVSRLSSRGLVIDSEVATATTHIESLRQRIALMEENYAGGEQARIAGELAGINEKKADADRLYTEAANEYRDRSSRLIAMQARHGAEKSKSESLRSEEASLRQDREELDAKVRGLGRRMESKNETLVGLREREQDLISGSGSSIGRLKEYDDRLRILRDRDRELTGQIGALERRSDSLKRDLADLAENEAKLQHALSASGFGMDVETFDVEPVVGGLTAELGALSALNAKAPETYADVSHGYRSMSARKNSLEEERNTIVKFIEGVERDKRQTFLDAFDRVDKEIRLIFSKMTGGNAWLELQNEDDVFGSGISYLIQFPNKQKRESMSISGGEKTLAAIVFVLALQKLKPSPFYLFDEVDAHLDAPNAERLSSILEERSKEGQFIMVSLKDSVIQKAKLIYGVFPKNGVSHVVTYRDRRMPSVRAP